MASTSTRAPAVHLWPGASPGILALHGFTGVGADFAPLASRLDRAMVAPDLAGHGPGPLPGDPRAHGVAHQVATLAPRLERHPIVLGYSMGGRIALSLAVERNPRALILVGATPGLDDPAERRARAAADRARADRIEAIGVPAFLAEWADVPIIASQRRIEREIRADMARHRRAHAARGLADSLRGVGTGVMPSLWHRLDAVRCPVLLLTGAEDTKFTAIAQRMVARLPDAMHHVVPGAGHCAHLERPDRVSRLIVEWLDGVAPAA